MRNIMKKAFGYLAAAGMYLALTAFPAMAQEEILINPNAVQTLQNAPADFLGNKYLELSAGEFFIGLPAEGCLLTTFSDCLQKYQPSDWALVGKDDCYFFFSDGAGNTLYFYLVPYELDDFGLTFNTNVEGLNEEQWRAVIERPLASHRALAPNSTISVYGDGDMNAIIAGITQINSMYPNGIATQPVQPTQPAQTVPALTGGWKLDNTGWWYDNGDGTWPAGGWKWIDGNLDGVAECYYFNTNGYLATNGTTPDGYQVNQNGAWTVNGVIQTQ